MAKITRRQFVGGTVAVAAVSVSGAASAVHEPARVITDSDPSTHTVTVSRPIRWKWDAMILDHAESVGVALTIDPDSLTGRIRNVVRVDITGDPEADSDAEKAAKRTLLGWAKDQGYPQITTANNWP